MDLDWSVASEISVVMVLSGCVMCRVVVGVSVVGGWNVMVRWSVERV